MKKKWLKAFVCLASCAAVALPAATGAVPARAARVNETIDFYLTVNVIEEEAMRAVAHAYEDMQTEKGNEITIVIHNTDAPDAYVNNLRNIVGNGYADHPTVASVATIPEYYTSDKILDLSGYLEEENEYIEDVDCWRDALEEDAYRRVKAGARNFIPGLSFSSNYTCLFYDKGAMKEIMGGDEAVDETGTVDPSKFTWEWMLKALKTAREKNPYFSDPLALSINESSCGQQNFNLITCIVNMYLDQYFRDFIEDVHSQEGDYSYIASVDKDWQYDENDKTLDLSRRYTYNLNRVVDNYFNHSAEYGPESPRYKELMENLHDLTVYCSRSDSYNDGFNRFNETTSRFENGSTEWRNLKLFYVESLGYVRTYRDAFKNKWGGEGFPSAEKITSMLGWLMLPPMPSELEGVAKDVRAWGGPLENYGVISTNSRAKDEIAVDFLKFLFSPAGQVYVSQTYEESNLAPQVMRQLIKGVEVPESIDYTAAAQSVEGDSSSTPYAIFGYGNGLSACRVEGSTDYAWQAAASTLSNYLKGSEREFTRGADLLAAFKRGFPDYAKQNMLVYTDPAQVAEATNGLKDTPYLSTGSSGTGTPTIPTDPSGGDSGCQSVAGVGAALLLAAALPAILLPRRKK